MHQSSKASLTPSAQCSLPSDPRSSSSRWRLSPLAWADVLRLPSAQIYSIVPRRVLAVLIIAVRRIYRRWGWRRRFLLLGRLSLRLVGALILAHSLCSFHVLT